MKRTLFLALLGASFCLGLRGGVAFGNDEKGASSGTPKVTDEIGDASTDAKKEIRTAKRNLRKSNDLGDSVSNEKNKAKRIGAIKR